MLTLALPNVEVEGVKHAVENEENGEVDVVARRLVAMKMVIVCQMFHICHVFVGLCGNL